MIDILLAHQKDIMAIQKKSALTIIQEIKQQLAKEYSDPILPEQASWWILQKITGKTKEGLLLYPVSWNDRDQTQLDQYLHDIVNEHKPLAYVLGSTPFGDLEILCEPPILIPRPETEEWVMDLIDQLKKTAVKKITILDLCTGTGCIALALAKALPASAVIASDISPHALALARRNATHNHINNVTFIQSDLFKEISPSFTFDIIVGNPPYIDPQDWQALDLSVKNWEDRQALIAPEHGLSLLKNIIVQAKQYIHDNSVLEAHHIPQLLLEIGYNQGQAVADILAENLYTAILIKKDSAKKDRLACARV